MLRTTLNFRTMKRLFILYSVIFIFASCNRSIPKKQTGTVFIKMEYDVVQRGHCNLTPGCQYYQNLTLSSNGKIIGRQFDDATKKSFETGIAIYPWPFYEKSPEDYLTFEVLLFEYHPMIGKDVLAELKVSVSLKNSFNSSSTMSTNNDQVSGTIKQIRIVCSDMYFGKFCQRYCYTKSSLYTCSEEGLRVCNQGRVGEYCEVYDICQEKPCPLHSVCRSLPNMERECLCKDGSAGNRCYLFYDPCQAFTCYNGGECVLTDHDHSAECSCPDGFKGIDCSLREDECYSNATHSQEKILQFISRNVTKICKNGGVCNRNQNYDSFDDADPFECHCSFLYRGKDCGDVKIIETVGILLGSMILAAALLFAISMAVKFYLRIKRTVTPRGYDDTSEEVFSRRILMNSFNNKRL